MKTVMKIQYMITFVLVAVFVWFFVLRNMDALQIQHKMNPPYKNHQQRVASTPQTQHGFCTFPPLFPEDAVEERQILDSVAWPETQLPLNLSVEWTSGAAHSTFTILPRRGGGQWHVGDQLEVMIKMSDTQGRPKKSGGDVILAKMYNVTLGAGVVGRVVDHLNGSYSAVFPLLWEGDVQVQVTLLHPNEAVAVLNRLNREQPDRITFRSVFRSGSQSETAVCNVCLRPTKPLCNYTDLHTGEPWFCYKPAKLGCNARINHAMGRFIQDIKAYEEKFFQIPREKYDLKDVATFCRAEANCKVCGVNLKVNIPASGPAGVTVLPKKEGQAEVKNSSSVSSGPSGYYYKNVWRALDGTTVRQFDTSAISQCLKGKMVHMYGDSTVRQYFEYLNAALPGLKEFNLHSPSKSGPYISLDYANNILVSYRFHSTPIRIVPVSTSEIRYIANELDGIIGGPNTVIVFCVWAHFGTFPMEIYIRRLQNIRRAVVRLLDRAPGTLVIIRTGNPKGLNLFVSLTNSDWHSLQCNKVLRAIFQGLNVHFIDSWEMVLASNLPHNLHPPSAIIKNMINVIFSYICPLKGR